MQVLNGVLISSLSANGPANYDDNAEVGRGGDDEDSSYLGRFSKQGDMDTLTKGALSRLDAPDQDSSYQLGEICQSVGP